jgi:hypothetical protein
VVLQKGHFVVAECGGDVFAFFVGEDDAVVLLVVVVVVVFIRGSVSLRPIAGKGPIFLKYMCESIIGFLMPTQGKCQYS